MPEVQFGLDPKLTRSEPSSQSKVGLFGRSHAMLQGDLLCLCVGHLNSQVACCFMHWHLGDPSISAGDVDKKAIVASVHHSGL